VPAPAPAPAPPAPAPAPPAPAAHAHPGCVVDAAKDAAKRQADLERYTSQLDLDGDGKPDPIFRGFCTMMGGNCDLFVYATGGGCTRFVGKVQQTEVTSSLHCAEPPQGGTPCKLSATRMMIHGELYEYFYVYGPNGYVEAGVGHRGSPPPAR
jgi:hypothetical protein